jgi:hypothetical protein
VESCIIGGLVLVDGGANNARRRTCVRSQLDIIGPSRSPFDAEFAEGDRHSGNRKAVSRTIELRRRIHRGRQNGGVLTQSLIWGISASAWFLLLIHQIASLPDQDKRFMARAYRDRQLISRLTL